MLGVPPKPGTFAGALALAVTWAVSVPAVAAPSALRQARRAYEQLDYDKVLPLLEKAMAAGPTPQERVEAYRLMANVHIAYGRQGAAVAAFEDLLRDAPDYALEAGVSPKLREALDEARARRVEPEQVVAATPVDEKPVPDLETRVAPSKPVWTRWWVWTIAGAVVVLGGSGIAAWQLSTDDRPASDHHFRL